MSGSSSKGKEKEAPTEAKLSLTGYDMGLQLNDDAINKIIGDSYGFNKIVNFEENKIKALTNPTDYIQERKAKYNQIREKAAERFKTVYNDMRKTLTEDEARRLAGIAAQGEIRVGLEELEIQYPSGLASMTETALFKNTLGGKVIPSFDAFSGIPQSGGGRPRGRPKGSGRGRGRKKSSKNK